MNPPSERAEPSALIDPKLAIDHPARAEGATLHGLLAGLDATAQRAWRDDPPPEPYAAAAPLISALIRTQGRRNHTLVDLLTALAAQTDQDFEILIIGHKVAEPERPALQRVVSDAPEFLRAKIRLVYLEDGGRARPLNFGFSQARGQYVAVIDDDDIPFAHWVETYRRLHQKSPGRVLRSVTARQNVVSVTVNGRRGLRATGTIERLYPPSFDAIDHLVGNQSPTTTLAFPRAAFRDLGLRFDESLSTAEDWDFLLRVSAVCGVVSSAQTASLYRWWQGEECSQTAHGPEEWRDNYLRILDKQAELSLIADGPTLARIREQALAVQSAEDRLNRAHDETARARDETAGARDEIRRLEHEAQRLGAQIAAGDRALAEALTRAATLEQAVTEAHDQRREAERRREEAERDWRRRAQSNLADLDEAANFGARLGPMLPPDLARALSKGLAAKLFAMKLRLLLFYPLAAKRRALRSRRRLYRQFLRHFNAAARQT